MFWFTGPQHFETPATKQIASRARFFRGRGLKMLTGPAGPQNSKFKFGRLSLARRVRLPVVYGREGAL
mgnify:CR=1 FL=1